MKPLIFAYEYNNKTYYAEGFNEESIRRAVESKLNLPSNTLSRGRKPDYNKELKEKMKGRGPNKIKPNGDGYYEANIRGNKKIYSCEEIYKNRRCNIENGAGYGFRPCYEDVNDKSTLQWWFIHY